MNKRQHGAVLIFSLVMLLLITLVGVNMIQQNRLQFMMAANMQGQTTLFASAENILELAESYIEKQRYYDGTSTCKTFDAKFVQLVPEDITAKTELNLSADTIASGVEVKIAQTACIPTAGENSGEEVVCPVPSGSNGGWSADDKPCNQSIFTACTTEIYTIRVTAPNSTTGGQRIVESKYAISCS